MKGNFANQSVVIPKFKGVSQRQLRDRPKSGHRSAISKIWDLGKISAGSHQSRLFWSVRLCWLPHIWNSANAG